MPKDKKNTSKLASKKEGGITEKQILESLLMGSPESLSGTSTTMMIMGDGMNMKPVVLREDPKTGKTKRADVKLLAKNLEISAIMSSLSHDAPIFRTAVGQFSAFVNSNTLSDAERKKEFAKLLPPTFIESIETNIQNIKKYEAVRIALGGEIKAQAILNFYQQNLGAAFFLNKNFKKAYDHSHETLKRGFVDSIYLLLHIVAETTTEFRVDKYCLKPMSATQEEVDQNLIKGDIYLKWVDEHTLKYVILGPDERVHRGTFSTFHLTLPVFGEHSYTQECKPHLKQILEVIFEEIILETNLILLKELGHTTDEAIKKDLHEIAKSSLKIYVKFKSATELEKFFKTYRKHLNLDDLLFVIESQKDPHQTAKWRKKFLRFLDENKNTIEFPEETIRKHREEHLLVLENYYLEKQTWLEGFDLIQKNIHFFTQAHLVQYAHSFLLSETVPRNIRKQAQKWLEEAAVEGNEIALQIYLDVFYTPYNRELFNPKTNTRIITAALKIERLASAAHFRYGQLFEDGYAVRQNYALAHHHYAMAANLEHLQALKNLSAMYANGQGVTQNLETALDCCRKSFEKGNPEAGIFMSTLLMKIHVESKATQVTSALEHAMRVLDVTEEMLKTPDHNIFPPAAIAALQADISYQRARCLLQISHPDKPIDSDKTCITVISPGEKNTYSVAIIQELQRAKEFGNEKTSQLAALSLGIFYLHGTHIDQNLAEADKLFEYVLELNTFGSNDDPTIEAHLLMLRSFIFTMQHNEEKGSGDLQKLPTKALGYYLQSMEMKGEEAPLFPGITTLSSCSSSIKLLTEKLQQYEPTNWIRQLTALKNKLNEEKLECSADDILELTQYIEGLGSHLLEATSLFPKLKKVVETFVVNTQEQVLDTTTLNSVFHSVAKWHLAGASASLEPLFELFKNRTMSFYECTQATKAFAQCGFSTEVQRAHIPELLSPLLSIDFKAWANRSSHPISDASRFLYALAVLDSHQSSLPDPDPTYRKLALNIIALLQTQLQSTDQIDLYSVSQLYHAHQYFQLRYPSQSNWPINECLGKLFEQYQEALQEDTAVTSSKTQKKIGSCLKEINSNIKEEAFIAGRRVDFLLEDSVTHKKSVIQHHGDPRHYFYDDAGEIAFLSPKDVLCEATLVSAKCEVKTISSPQWQAIPNKRNRQKSYLCERFPALTKTSATVTALSGNPSSLFPSMPEEKVFAVSPSSLKQTKEVVYKAVVLHPAQAGNQGNDQRSTYR